MFPGIVCKNQVTLLREGDVKQTTGRLNESPSRETASVANLVGAVFPPLSADYPFTLLARRVKKSAAVSGPGWDVHLGFFRAARANDQLKEHYLWKVVEFIRQWFGWHDALLRASESGNPADRVRLVLAYLPSNGRVIGRSTLGANSSA